MCAYDTSGEKTLYAMTKLSQSFQKMKIWEYNKSMNSQGSQHYTLSSKGEYLFSCEDLFDAHLVTKIMSQKV